MLLLRFAFFLKQYAIKVAFFLKQYAIVRVAWYIVFYPMRSFVRTMKDDYFPYHFVVSYKAFFNSFNLTIRTSFSRAFVTSQNTFF